MMFSEVKNCMKIQKAFQNLRMLYEILENPKKFLEKLEFSKKEFLQTC